MEGCSTYNRPMRLRRAALLLSLSVAALALLPASASADNDNFACQAMPTNTALKRVFDLPHVIVQKNPGGGTDDELGAFTSSCFGYLYRKKAVPRVSPFGLPPSLKVRKGFAKLHVSVTFQQEEPPKAKTWDPDAIGRVAADRNRGSGGGRPTAISSNCPRSGRRSCRA